MSRQLRDIQLLRHATLDLVRGQRIIRHPIYWWPWWRTHLAICAIFKDEARYLGEWIEFHQAQGVQRFYLYENNSTDEWEAALEPYARVVEVHHWPHQPGQLSAYSDCLRQHRWDTRWIAFLDLDEFLYSPTGSTLPEVLRGFPRVPGVVANWRIYGTNGHDTAPEGSVVESYPVPEPEGHPWNRNVKAIVFPAMTTSQVIIPHNFLQYGVAVGEDGRPCSGPFRDPSWDLLRINHYATRSRAEQDAKMLRPRADTGEVRGAAWRDSVP